MNRPVEIPAILGGEPVRPQGPPGWPRRDQSIVSILSMLAESGDWGRYEGPHVPELGRRLAEYHDVSEVVLCSSGTAAVELALRGLGVVADDEVILAGYDFKANFQNVLCIGAVPVLVDLSPLDWQIDPGQIEQAITTKTRAIIVSHLHGGLVDMAAVRKCADHAGITVLEDACQSPGAVVNQRIAGTWGDVGVISFGGSKLLTSGRGGAVITRSREIAERIKRYLQRGNLAYPLSEMQAAILLPQLEQLDELNNQRRATVQELCTRLSETDGLAPLQIHSHSDEPVYYKVGLRYDLSKMGGLPRDLFVAAMRAEGVAMDAGFRALHLIHAARRFRTVGTLPEASRADAEMLTLHHPILLEEITAIEQIMEAIEKVRSGAEQILRSAANGDDRPKA